MTFPMTISSVVAMTITGVVTAYLILGNLWHRVWSPFPRPHPDSFPRAGDRFGSVAEGVQQEVHRVEGGMIYGRAILEPGAAGPPMHTHDGFPETFSPLEGKLHVQLSDRVVTLLPGDTLTLPAGVPHRPFNPTSARVVLGGDRPIFPQQFGASLVQLYRFMDERGTHPLTMLLQMSVLDPIADTHLANVPRAMEPVMRAVLGPLARLLGYRNYYAEWALHPTPAAPVQEDRARVTSLAKL